ncbi:MAG: hypothetical protein MUE78_09450, partial [Ilumatobacteraceae bacterium]|nr:hypothetical protein [Ilumatobacteraceae bacterium]
MSLLWSNALSGGQLADRIHLIADADLDPRLRNALLVDVYCDLSEDVAGVIYGMDVPVEHVRPNFYTYAIWGAHTVGVQLRRRFVPGATRRARALESGNAAIIAEIGDAAYWFRKEMSPSTSWEWAPPPAPEPPHTADQRSTDDRRTDPPAPTERDPAGGERGGDDGGATRHRARRRPPAGGRRLDDSFLTEPSCGLPSAVLDAAGCRSDDTVADAIARFRARGLACYRSATEMRIDAERRCVHNVLPDEQRRTRDRLVLEGSAWLAMAEQCLIEDQIAVAARVNVRRWTTAPWHRLTMSQREWRGREVSGPALRLEHWFGRMATRRLLAFEHPSGAIGYPHTMPGGGLPIARWYRDARARQRGTWEELGTPFGLVDQVESVDWWPSIRERLAAIFLLMATTHDAPWFAEQRCERRDVPQFANLHRPPPWPGSASAEQALGARLRSPRNHRGAARGTWTELVDCPTHERPRDQQPSEAFATAGDWQHAVEVYDAYRTFMFLALFVRSLPASFTSPSGAAVLDPASVGADFTVSPR